MTPFRSPSRLVLPLFLVTLAASFSGQGRAQAPSAGESMGEPRPENTVVLASRATARFSRDFSLLLKQLRLDWVAFEGEAVPEVIRDKNLLLLGRPGDPESGEIIRRVLTAEDLEELRAAEGPLVIERDSPWTPDRRVYVCSGADFLLVRNAAENAVRSLMERSPPASGWIRTRFDAPLDDALRSHVDGLRFSWDDAELPLADLTMEPGGGWRWRVSTQQAVEDVERFFHLFRHGYAGYAYFNQEGELERARARLLGLLSTRSAWAGSALAKVLHEQLGFISDCHLKIGKYRYGGHMDFWYDSSLELTPGPDGYEYGDGEGRQRLISVNDEDPRAFVFPSLNEQGEAIYRLGTLSRTEPEPLELLAAGDAGERRLEIELRRSNYDHHSREIFREDRIGGIPVIRVRSFGDVNEADLRRFVETGSAHRGAPVLIVDARGNQGGNETWPIQWIQGLTGRRAESVFIFSELHSKTTMAGRANIFADLRDRYPENSRFGEDAAQHAALAEGFESGDSRPFWVGPYYPQMPLIPNNTTLIIVTNGRVASAGEGLVMRASQAENVVLVGENTTGCLTFGNAGTHRLPHTGLAVSLPINFGLYLDGISREERGVAPDLWVPAADAVNYAVAAVRNGTITTRQPIPAAILQTPFVREDPWATTGREKLLVVVLSAGGIVWVYFMRRRPDILAAMGIVWVAVGGAWLWMGKSIGIAFLITGVACLIWGGIRLARPREASETVK